MLLDKVPNSGVKKLGDHTWNIRKPKGFLYFQGDYKGEKG